MAVAANSIQIDPLFDSAYAALAFAFRYSTQQYSPTPMARLMRGTLGSGKGLHGLDGAAQAGIIRAEVNRIREYERSALVARFSQDKEGLQAKMNLIHPATASLGTGVHNRRMVDNLVQRHYGKRSNLKDLGEAHGVHANTMTQRWACIHRLLTSIDYRAMDLAEARLREAGLVP